MAKHFEGLPTDHVRDGLERYSGTFPRSLSGLNQGLRGQAGPVEASYLAALLAVRTLIDDEGFWTVRRILESVGRGAPFPASFEEEARMSLGEFEEDWVSALP